MKGRGKLGDLVEEQGAALGRLEETFLVDLRAGEGALHVAEELALDQALGDCAAIHRDERLLRARALGVHRARDQLLADAALAGDEHRGPRHRHLVDQLEHALHGGAAPDHVAEPRAPLELLAQELIVLGQRPAPRRQLALLQRPFDQRHDFRGEARRLLQIAERAQLQRPLADVLAAEGGHDDDFGLRLALLHLAQHVQAVAALPDPQVGDHHVEVGRREGAVGGGQVLGLLDRMPFGGEAHVQHRADAVLVVDDEEPRHCPHSTLRARRAPVPDRRPAGARPRRCCPAPARSAPRSGRRALRRRGGRSPGRARCRPPWW